MADFILLEPFCDIHLVLDPNFRRDPTDPETSLNNLELRVFEAERNGLRHDLEVVTNDLEFDFFDPAASTQSPGAGVLPPTIDQDRIDRDIVHLAFDSNTGIRTLEPRGVGTVFMQIRYLDPELQDDAGVQVEYHYLVARIQVHQAMNGWWFGNNSLSVYQDPDFAHSQISLYALFDRDAAHGGVVGDITGHGYVQLSSDNRAVVELDTNFPNGNQYRDRVRGVSAGETTIEGDLLQEVDLLTVRCINLRSDPTDPPNPVLDRVTGNFNGTVPRRTRHNILFLGEGFRASDFDRFQETVKKLSHDLFDCKRHSPFNLLKDGFNIWSHFAQSVENGITIAPEMSLATGRAIPWKETPKKGSPQGSYSLRELIILIGLPIPLIDSALSNDALRTRWNAANSVPRLMGFQRNRAVNNVVDEWKKLTPAGIPQTRDTFYGMQQGSRWGDRESEKHIHDDMVVPPVLGDPNNRQVDFAKRMHTWFEARVRDPRSLVHDPRRSAPEFTRFRHELIIRHIARFADPRVVATDPDHLVGVVWDRNIDPDPSAPERQVNSAGLVCILTNHEGARGRAERRVEVRIALGTDHKYSFEVDRSDPDFRPLNMTQKIKPKLSSVLNILAHEFGHSFNLGDEYDRRRRGASHSVEQSDNLTYVRSIEIPPKPGNIRNLDFPTPVDPNNVKWATLHRIKQADMLETPSEVTGSQITVTLTEGQTRRWRKARDQGTPVFLRRDKIRLRDYNLLRTLGDHFFDCNDFTLNRWRVDGPNPGPHNFTTFPQLVDFMNANDPNGHWTFDNFESINGGDPTRDYGSMFIITNCRPDENVEHEVRFSRKRKQLPITDEDLLQLTINSIPDTQTIVLTGAPPHTRSFPAGSVLYIPKQEFGQPANLVKTGVMTFMRAFSWDPSLPPGRALSENHNKDAQNLSDPPDGGKPDDPEEVPGVKAPCCARYTLLGLYEGGSDATVRVYRPAGGCKMRASQGEDEEGQFCFVCKYLIVNRVDPSKHAELDDCEYP
ncbi:MAG: hypothetical protein NPIRA05_01010 [Nitrospirales bacterium]|nr:MAG: hypothetical protein NPIRA05_01010 [Nitrospirales bacterium]GJL83985.1 MAG: hypothetical protein DHS20C01_36190 [marine bacterium B5-7]